MRDNFARIYNYINNLPVVSTHEHHLKDDDQIGLDLKGIFEHSYVAWQMIPVGNSYEEHRRFLESARYNSYFVWLEKSLSIIYGFNERITADNWDEISDLIKTKHSDINEHIRILKEECRYIKGITDIYWSPGSYLGHEDIFSPVIRIDAFLLHFHPSQRFEDVVVPWDFIPGLKGLKFDEYIEAVLSFLRKKVESGAVGFKLAAAYDRPIKFNDVSFDKAAKIFMRDPSSVSEDEWLSYGDYIIGRVCELAEELNVPIQVHTGLAKLPGSNPMNFENTIERFPNVRFILFHGGYPWIHEVAALAHNFKNVYVDVVWLPIISTTAAVEALGEYIEVVPSIEKIMWGSDSWTSEEAFGALLAYQHVLAKVLADKIDSGYINFEDAKYIAERLMYKNALKTFFGKKSF